MQWEAFWLANLWGSVVFVLIISACIFACEVENVKMPRFVLPIWGLSVLWALFSLGGTVYTVVSRQLVVAVP